MDIEVATPYLLGLLYFRAGIGRLTYIYESVKISYFVPALHDASYQQLYLISSRTTTCVLILVHFILKD